MRNGRILHGGRGNWCSCCFVFFYGNEYYQKPEDAKRGHRSTKAGY